MEAIKIESQNSLFAINSNYRLWKYAVIVSDTDGNLYVKDGDTRQNTKEEALDYAASETTGKIRGLVREDDILGVWDMTEDAIKRDASYDPTIVDTNYRRGYDNEIRDLMPLKRKFIKNFRGQNSLELHPIPKSLLEDPNWRQLLAYQWDSRHLELQNGGQALSLKKYTARQYLVESFVKTSNADVNKFLLAAATGAGKETSTLALLIYIHDVKKYDTKKLSVAVATIPSTVSELMSELATVSGMQVPGYGFVDYSRIAVYLTRQWYDSYKKDCSPQAKTMIANRATIVASVKDIPKTHPEGVVPVLFGSYHDLALKSGAKLDARYAGLDKRIGTLSIGEAHQMLGNADNKMWKQLDNMFGKKCFKLFVTGTPYDFIYGNASAEFFNVDHRALFTRNDLYRDKRNNVNSDFSEYPDFNFYGIDVNEVVSQLKNDPNWKDDTEGFTWGKLFSYNPDTAKFKYENTVLWIFKRMFGSSAFDENGDPLSIYNAPDLCDVAKQHIMVALPVGNKAASATVYINALKTLLTKHGIFEGTIFDAYEDGLGDRKDDIANAYGRTLTLTCVKDCTGANIPQLGSFVFLRNLGDSIKFFEQATGRVGRKFDNKTNCGVFIGDLEASMNIMVTIEEKISLERSEDFSSREVIENILANYNFFSGRNGSWTQLDLQNFADILEELNARGNYGINQCANQTEAAEGFDLLFNNTTSTESMRVDINSNGNKGAKDFSNKTFEQLGLPFDKSNTADQNWHNMKLTFIAKCRWLAYIYDAKTVSQCVALVSDAVATNNKEVLSVIGKGAEWFPVVMGNEDEIDARYTNRWIQKFNDNKNDADNLFAMLEDPIHRSDDDFVAEPTAFLSEIAEKVLTKIPNSAGLSLYDPCAGRGGLLVYILKEAQARGIVIDPANVYYNDIDPVMATFFKALNKNLGLKIPAKNITCKEFMHKKHNMHFSIIVGNPPYNGKAALHQQFFNKCYSLLTDNGVMAFVQPATTYFNKKTKQKDAVGIMQGIVQNNPCEVTVKDPEVFATAGIQNDLSITYLTKAAKTNSNIDLITYKNGHTYSDVPLEDISMTQIDPFLYATIRGKYIDYAEEHGNLEDVITKDENVFKATLPKIRGTRPTDADFYTFIPKVSAKKQALIDDAESSFGVVATSARQVSNIYDYLESDVARFGLALLKFSQNTANKEFALVPLVNFNKKYADADLFKMLKLTAKEVAAIKNVIVDYYGR